MEAHISAVSKAAALLVALLSIGPLVTGLDLVLHFLPTQFPAIQNFHAAAPLKHLLWVGSGLMGTLTAFLLLRRPVLAFATCVAFTAAYVPGAVMVWLHFTFGCWLAILAVVLSAIGAAVWLRANNSFKPKPLRGSA